jgi:hypothetical protein
VALPPTAIHTVKAILRVGPLSPDDLIEAMARKGWADVDLGDLLQLIATRGATAGIWTDGKAISAGTRPHAPVATVKAAAETIVARERAALPVSQRPQGRPQVLRSLEDLRLETSLLRAVRRALSPSGVVGLTCPDCLNTVMGGVHPCPSVR